MDTLLDVAKLLPFLFLTYAAMEYLEHRAGGRTEALVKRAGRLGPVIGAGLGAVPQCGFSAAASNLYAGHVITRGTLIAIYLSTSDEMLPVLISEKAPVGLILQILLGKALIGMGAGLAIDLFGRRKKERKGQSLQERDLPGQEQIHEFCEQGHCRCEKGIWSAALVHTARIAFFILLITFGLNLILFWAGEEALESMILNNPAAGPILAGIVGLLPNCAGSVVITQLYLKGVIGIGAAMAGLLTGSGIGLLVLFRVNHNRRENLKLLGLLYSIGVLAGIVIEWIL